jgi:hypothetical protein
MSEFFRKENINFNINIYVIGHTPEKPTKLYRGDKNGINPQDKLSKDYLFFTPKMEQAEQYGNVSEFETTKPLRVVALDDITEDFFNFAPEDVQNHLVSNYGYNTKQKKKYVIQQRPVISRYHNTFANKVTTDTQSTLWRQILMAHFIKRLLYATLVKM